MKNTFEVPEEHCFSRIRHAPSIAVLTIFVLMVSTAPAHAQTYTVLHNFSGGADGSNPYSALTIDAAGNLYGTTYYGGGGTCPANQGHPSGCGVVFKLAHKSSGWVETPIYAFQGGTDGAYPQAQLVLGPDGNLYGSTFVGGGNPRCDGYRGYQGCGTVFKLTPPASVCKGVSCPWSETVLYRFNGNPEAYPVGQLAFDNSGNIYGVAGTDAYELSPSNGEWIETVLFAFNSFDTGEFPEGGVVVDADGNVYGPLALYGAGGGYGAVFQLVKNGPSWTENLLYSFQGEEGGAPVGGLIFANSGSGCLIGATSQGPGFGQLGGGIEYSVCPMNGGWSFSSGYIFQPWQYSGPTDKLTQDAAGNLYGTDVLSAFKLGINGYVDMHDFSGGQNGSSIGTALVLDGSGNLYGTAFSGGSGSLCTPPNGGCGLVFAITP